jgi:hypothetical protein
MTLNRHKRQYFAAMHSDQLVVVTPSGRSLPDLM